MVKLTFIRQSDIDENDIGLTVKMAKQVYLLSKALREKHGIPDYIYASKKYRAYLMALVSNLGFKAKNVVFYNALRKETEKREIRAFFDFILSEASTLKHKHLVVVCDASIFKYAFIQLPPVGSSVTICGDNWRNLLQGYTSSWIPNKADKLSDEDVKFIKEKIIDAVCNNEEIALIHRTMKEAYDNFVS